MSYLQITTRCQMTCAHCCYSCGPKRGKHMEWGMVLDAISLMEDQDSHISIGGGEPTMHPRFFDALKRCLDSSYFEHVWLATNGGYLKKMKRLFNILMDCDYESFERDDYCDCDRSLDDWEAYCYCQPSGLIYQENKLAVALSQDYFHSRIDPWVVSTWTSYANRNRGFEIRNVSANVAGQGRAKVTGSGWGDQCVCSAPIYKPDGTIRLCGCTGAPVIGLIRNGIHSDWAEFMMENEKYLNSGCYRETSPRIRRKLWRYRKEW